MAHTAKSKRLLSLALCLIFLLSVINISVFVSAESSTLILTNDFNFVENDVEHNKNAMSNYYNKGEYSTKSDLMNGGNKFGQQVDYISDTSGEGYLQLYYTDNAPKNDLHGTTGFLLGTSRSSSNSFYAGTPNGSGTEWDPWPFKGNTVYKVTLKYRVDSYVEPAAICAGTWCYGTSKWLSTDFRKSGSNCMGASSNAGTGFTGVYIGPDSELGVWKEATFYLKSRGDGEYRMSNMTIGLDSVDDTSRCKPNVNDGKSTTVSIDDVILYETAYASADMCEANIVPYSDTDGKFPQGYYTVYLPKNSNLEELEDYKLPQRVNSEFRFLFSSDPNTPVTTISEDTTLYSQWNARIVNDFNYSSTIQGWYDANTLGDAKYHSDSTVAGDQGYINLNYNSNSATQKKATSAFKLLDTTKTPYAAFAPQRDAVYQVSFDYKVNSIASPGIISVYAGNATNTSKDYAAAFVSEATDGWKSTTAYCYVADEAASPTLTVGLDMLDDTNRAGTSVSIDNVVIKKLYKDSLNEYTPDKLVCTKLDANYEGAKGSDNQYTFYSLKGEKLGESLVPIRDNYLFYGWKKKANGSGETVTTNEGTNNPNVAPVLYVYWRKSVKVTYVPDCYGLETKTVRGVAGDALPDPGFSRYLYTVEWRDSANQKVTVTPDSDTTLYASWTRKNTVDTEYDIQTFESFDAKEYSNSEAGGVHGMPGMYSVTTEKNKTNGGSKSLKLNITADTLEKAAQALVPVAENNGAVSDLSVAVGDSYQIELNLLADKSVALTYFAASVEDADKISSTASYEAYGIVDLTANEWQTVTLSIANVKKSGYLTLGAFFANASTYNQANVYIDDIKVVKHSETEKITFVTGTEQKLDSVKVYADAKIGTLPTPVRSGFVFKGWYDKDGKLYGSSSFLPNGATELVLTARWINPLELTDPESYAAQDFSTADAGNHSAIDAHNMHDSYDNSDNTIIHGTTNAREIVNIGGNNALKLTLNSGAEYTAIKIGNGNDAFDFKGAVNNSNTVTFKLRADTSVSNLALSLVSCSNLADIYDDTVFVEATTSVSADSSWQEVSINVPYLKGANGAAAYLLIGFETSTKTSVYIDDVQVSYPKVVLTTCTLRPENSTSMDALVGMPYSPVGSSLKTPTRSGYLFDGWYDQNGVYYNTDSVYPNSDVTLTARWESIPSAAENYETGFVSGTDFNLYINFDTSGNYDSRINSMAYVSSQSGASDSGKLILTNDTRALWNSQDKLRPAARLIKSNGTSFIAKKDTRYRISYYTKGEGIDDTYDNSAASYVMPIVSSTTADNIYTTSAVSKSYVFSLESGYTYHEYYFDCYSDGYLYLTMANRKEWNKAGHSISIDDISVEVVNKPSDAGANPENVIVKVTFDGIKDVFGKPGDPLPTVYGANKYSTNQLFEGWYTDQSLTEKATVFPTQDTRFYAKYVDYNYGDAQPSENLLTASFEEDYVDLFYTSMTNMSYASDMDYYEAEVVHGDSENARTGDSYLKLNYVPRSHEGLNGDPFILIYNPDSTSSDKYLWLEPNTSYRFTYWYKATSDFDISSFYATLVAANSTSAMRKPTDGVKYWNHDTIDAKKGEWVKVEKVFTTPDEVTTVLINLHQGGTGHVFNAMIDDISLVKLENNTVKFDMNGGQEIPDITVLTGETIGALDNEPFYYGYTFDGWYADKALTKAFDIENDPITSDITLYAKWVKTEEEDSDSDNNSNNQTEESNNTSNSSGNSSNSSNNTSDVISNGNTNLLPDTDISEAADYGESPQFLDADAVQQTLPSSDSSTEDGIAVWQIVIICVAGVLVVGGLATFLILYRKKKSKITIGGK